VYRQSRPLDRELIDWRAGGTISALYEEVYQHLADHPIVKTIQLVERLHSVRGAVHGLNPEIEAAHPDGLWADLRQLCEEAGWELSRLQLIWAKAERAQGPRVEAVQPWRSPESIGEDTGERFTRDRGLDDMESIADQPFGEGDL
jgi:hypothetical protein